MGEPYRLLIQPTHSTEGLSSLHYNLRCGSALTTEGGRLVRPAAPSARPPYQLLNRIFEVLGVPDGEDCAVTEFAVDLHFCAEAIAHLLHDVETQAG